MALRLENPLAARVVGHLEPNSLDSIQKAPPASKWLKGQCLLLVSTSSADGEGVPVSLGGPSMAPSHVRLSAVPFHRAANI